MAEHPMFPLWTDAYLADTNHLTTIEHGAYLLLMIAMWRTREKRLPDDDKQLCRYCRLTPAQWARIKPTIMPFFDAADGYITQARLTDEAEAVRQHSKQQSDKAKARWLKSRPLPDAAAMPERCPLPTSLSKTTESYPNVVALSPKPEPGTSIVASVPKQPQKYPGEFGDFWSAFPQRPTDTKKLAFANWQKAVASGVDPPTLQAGAERYAAFVGRTGHESMLVQTWINRQGWTASYAGSNGCGNGKASIVERVASRLRAEGQDQFGADGPVVESREAEWRRRRH